MKNWKIDYWSATSAKGPVEKWLGDLTKEQLKAVLKELKFLQKIGNELKLPHSKPLGHGLFELREYRYGYRLYYCFHGKQLVILLAAGDKTSQDRDIKIARERLSKLEG